MITWPEYWPLIGRAESQVTASLVNLSPDAFFTPQPSRRSKHFTNLKLQNLITLKFCPYFVKKDFHVNLSKEYLMFVWSPFSENLLLADDKTGHTEGEKLGRLLWQGSHHHKELQGQGWKRRRYVHLSTAGSWWSSSVILFHPLHPINYWSLSFPSLSQKLLTFMKITGQVSSALTCMNCQLPHKILLKHNAMTMKK